MARNIVYIGLTREFEKQLRKAPIGIQEAFRKRWAMYLQDPKNPLLHNHMLVGSYLGKRSINITGDWRVVFTETQDIIGGWRITVEAIGTHSQLYK